MKDRLVLGNGKSRKLEEFIVCFQSLGGKHVKIHDQEEALITGTVDGNYDFSKNRNYRLVNAVPLISSPTNEPQPEYFGEFGTITEIYVSE